MLNLKFYFVILLVLFSVFCFSNQIDPISGNQVGYKDEPISIEDDYVRSTVSRDSIPPSFDITHISNGEVTIYVTSDEDLFAGWVDEKLIWSVTNFDYWWLNTRLAKDSENNIYAAVKLYEYSNPNSNFDMYVLHNNGDVIEENLIWNGPGGNPLIVNYPDENVYIGQPTLDPEGAIDSNNITYVFSNAGGSNVLFTKIDADGTILINNQTIITGANAWTNEIRVEIDTNDNIYLVWSKDMHDITYAYSDDSGDSWSVPVSLCYNASNQLNKPQVCCDSNDNVHIIWQHWTGASNLLSYMKLRPDGSIAINESFLTQSNNQVWSARMDIDEENNLHIVWAKSSQQITSAYYTKINGNLDGSGLSMTDAELSLIQEYAFLSNQNIRHPKCVVDNYQNAHSIYEQGNYGCNENKSVYYKKMNSVPLLRIECPNDSVLFVEMTGSGTNWEGVFTPPELGIYDVRVSASDIDGNTGVDYYQFEYTGVNNGYISGNVVLSGGVGAFENVQVIAGIYSTNPDTNGDYIITLPPGTYDVTASLEYYESNTIIGVVVEEGMTTSGVDLILVFNPPLNPPTNVVFNPFIGIVFWEPPEYTTANIMNYNIYLDDMTTPIAVVEINVFEYQYSDLIPGQQYTAGVSAIYEEGESDIIEDNGWGPYIFNPPTNASYEIIDDYIHITWQEPEPGSTHSFLNYRIYLDGELLEETNELSYDIYDLVSGQIYLVGLTAFYEYLFESDPIEFEITFTGGSSENVIPVSALYQNYPNPFKPSGAGRSPATTTISFSVAQTLSFVTLDIYNIKGQKVKTLVKEVMPAGNHSVVWDGTDENNKPVSSGIFFYKLNVDGKTKVVKKMILMK